MTCCRMVGYIGTDRERLSCALHQLKDVLVAAEGSGYGVAHYSDEALLLNRRPGVAISGHSYAELTGGVRTRVLLAHAFPPHEDNVQARDLHPFKFRNWAFAMTGTLPEDEASREVVCGELMKGVPDFLLRNVQGHSCAEALFHHFLLRLHDVNQLRNGVHDIAAVALALRESVDSATTLAKDNGVVEPALNVIATDGHRLYVLRRGAAIAQYMREGIVSCELCYGSGDGMDSFSLRESHQRFRAVLFAVDVDEAAEGWKLLEPDVLLVVDGSMEIQML